jgi:hypothetical protein
MLQPLQRRSCATARPPSATKYELSSASCAPFGHAAESAGPKIGTAVDGEILFNPQSRNLRPLIEPSVGIRVQRITPHQKETAVLQMEDACDALLLRFNVF